MKAKFWVALGSFAVFAVLAGVTLSGRIRLATWIFFGALALKTWLATLYK